jgi:polyphosphate glucokinase
METLGIDIGGSGIKGAIVSTETGDLVTERMRIPTPQPAKPHSVVEVVQQIVRHFDYRGSLGAGYPGVVVNGVTMTAANVDDDWINFPAAASIAARTGCDVIVRNDADAAGIAEMHHGAGRRVKGVVMIFTLGTGIGSAMFVDGRLVPNLELGHLYLRNEKKDAEYQTAERARKGENLSWNEWGVRLNTYFNHIESLFSPDLMIIGGGVSKKHEKFLHHIKVRAKVVPAQLFNEAGIVGAAMAAVQI